MEQQTNTTEQNTAQPEKKELERFDVIADSIIEGSQYAENAEARLDIARVFLSELRSDAEAGYVKSRGGQVYDLEDFDQRLFAFAEEMALPEDKRDNPEGLIPRSEGMRASLMKLMSNELTAQPLLDAIAEQERAHEAQAERLKSVSEAMGEGALKAAAIESPAETNPYDNLFSPDYTPSDNPEDAAVRFESDEDRLKRQRQWDDEKDAALKRAGRPEMN